MCRYCPNMTEPAALNLTYGQPHEHLPLAAVVRAGDRRRRPVGFRRTPHYGDRVAHARELGAHATRLTQLHAERTPILGVQPDLILRARLNRPVDPNEFTKAGLQVLDMADDLVVVAFASDPALTAFMTRLARYEQGPAPLADPSDKDRAAPLEGFFDAIDGAEPWQPVDCLTPAAVQLLEESPSGRRLRVDVQCWCPEERADAERIRNDVMAAVDRVNGRVLDHYLNERAGLSLLRLQLDARDVRTLVDLDRIRRLDVLPSPQVSFHDVVTQTVADLPVVLAPPVDAPVLAIIDSGVRSAHPMIGPAVVAVETLLPEIPDGEDRTGHGTHVASLALYGSLENQLAASTLQSAGRLLSIRVLDDHDNFPDERLWETHLNEVIRYAAGQGARIVNLSIADNRTTYSGSRPTPVAALIDQLVRDLRLVLVTVTGNIEPSSYSPDESVLHGYLIEQLDSSESRLLEPGPSALALTVGGLCPDVTQGARPVVENVTVRSLGQPGWPSPITRRGPGIAKMVKPDLVAPAGSYVLDTDMHRIAEDRAVGVVGADGTAPERLLTTRVGTSQAAPVVSHVALSVAAAYPDASPNLIRALVLQGVIEVRVAIERNGPAATRDAKLSLRGYGRVDLRRAVHSSDHRVVLVADGAMTVDTVDIYRVPIPSSFFQSGGWREVVVTLAYDPPVRVTRLDYCASRMEFQLYRKTTLEDIEREYLRQLEQEAAARAAGIPTDVAASQDHQVEDDDDSFGPHSLAPFRVTFNPPSSVRSRGANQYGSRRFPQRFTPEDGEEMFLVVRNVNRWDTFQAQQDYAIAVVLDREPGRPELYAELEARLLAQAEIPPVQVETELDG